MLFPFGFQSRSSNQNALRFRIMLERILASAIFLPLQFNALRIVVGSAFHLGFPAINSNLTTLMKQHKQRIAIAEACGATWVNVPPKPENGFSSEYHPKRLLTFTPGDLRILPLADPITHDSILTPDYCNDLNAMHEAEKALPDNLFVEYANKIPPCSTAAYRAELFLKTLNLWKP